MFGYQEQNDSGDHGSDKSISLAGITRLHECMRAKWLNEHD